MNPVPIPLDDPIAQPKRESYGKRKDPQEGHVTRSWVDWLTQLGATIEQAPARRGTPVSLDAQSASIGATDLSGGTLPAGLYRLAYYARITLAASISSSLTITFSWTDRGVSPSFTGAALSGNTVTTVGSDTLLIRSDGLSPITYSTTYASNAPGMQYSLDVSLESVST